MRSGHGVSPANRLLDLEHVVERARVHGIAFERLRCRTPTIAFRPCPSCGRKYTALAEWDGFGVRLLCNGCRDSRMIEACLLAMPGEDPGLVEVLEATIGDLEARID